MTENRQKKYNNPVIATITGIVELFKKKEISGELKPGDRLDGKTVLVDGSSSGLGFAIATDLARRGAKVVMAVRSGIPGKGEMVKKLSGSENVHMLHVDLSDLSSIRHLVSSIRKDFAPLDIVICNAGIVPKKSRKTPQGLEEMFMVNYFSKFVLVNLLLEKGCILMPGKDDPADHPDNLVPHPTSHVPRIIFVTSESHRNPEKIEWDRFGSYEEYGIGRSMELYGYYKLLLVTFSRELSRRLNPGGSTNASVFAMCPGPVNSNIAREAPKIFHPLLKLVFSIFFRSPAEAAVPVVYLAASPDMETKPFDYFFLMTRKAIDEKASDPENGKKLWEESEKLMKQRMNGQDHVRQ